MSKSNIFFFMFKCINIFLRVCEKKRQKKSNVLWEVSGHKPTQFANYPTIT